MRKKTFSRYAYMVFHSNPGKFRNFQTVAKYFLKHYGAQSASCSVGWVGENPGNEVGIISNVTNSKRNFEKLG